MGLDQLIRRVMGERPRPDAQWIRKLRPIRNPVVVRVDVEDGSVHLQAPLDVSGRGLVLWMARRTGRDITKTFELESVGAFVWDQCDGETDFTEIARRLCVQYKLSRAESEAALSSFLLTLSQRKLVSFSPPTVRVANTHTKRRQSKAGAQSE